MDGSAKGVVRISGRQHTAVEGVSVRDDLCDTAGRLDPIRNPPSGAAGIERPNLKLIVEIRGKAGDLNAHSIAVDLAKDENEIVVDLIQCQRSALHRRGTVPVVKSTGAQRE